MKTNAILLTTAMLSLSTLSFTSCSNMGGVTGTITTAQAWLNDPANQAMINAIANTVIGLIGAFGSPKTAGARATITGKLAPEYPNVPAGALSEIAQNPYKYIKH